LGDLRAHRRRAGQADHARQGRGGIIVTMLLGIVGAVVAGYIGQAMGLYTEGQPAGFVMSLLGAIALLFVYRLATKRTPA
jgi:uncharacterized membrane protein YeaQ/YmgE (transglycosylase-associated protein family)